MTRSLPIFHNADMVRSRCYQFNTECIANCTHLRPDAVVYWVGLALRCAVQRIYCRMPRVGGWTVETWRSSFSAQPPRKDGRGFFADARPAFVLARSAAKTCALAQAPS